MTHRPSPDKTAALRAWERFVSANAPVIASSGIPAACLASVDHFDDFLLHGHLAHHPDGTDFQLESLSTDQYGQLVLLVESYFAAGYEWFTPRAIRSAERERLGSRFGPSSV